MTFSAIEVISEIPKLIVTDHEGRKYEIDCTGLVTDPPRGATDGNRYLPVKRVPPPLPDLPEFTVITYQFGDEIRVLTKKGGNWYRTDRELVAFYNDDELWKNYPSAKVRIITTTGSYSVPGYSREQALRHFGMLS